MLFKIMCFFSLHLKVYTAYNGLKHSLFSKNVHFCSFFTWRYCFTYRATLEKRCVRVCICDCAYYFQWEDLESSLHFNMPSSQIQNMFIIWLIIPYFRFVVSNVTAFYNLIFKIKRSFSREIIWVQKNIFQTEFHGKIWSTLSFFSKIKKPIEMLIPIRIDMRLLKTSRFAREIIYYIEYSISNVLLKKISILGMNEV